MGASPRPTSTMSSPPTSPASPMAPISPLSSNDGLDGHVSRRPSTLNPEQKLTILHLGDPIKFHLPLGEELSSRYNVIRPDPEDLERKAFMEHLRKGTWGQFSAIMRPFWATGKEMHPWDRQLIELLPESMEVMASAGAGFDWVNVDALTGRGTSVMFATPRGTSLVQSYLGNSRYFIH